MFYLCAGFAELAGFLSSNANVENKGEAGSWLSEAAQTKGEQTMSIRELQADELRFVCRNCLFPFETTAEVAPLDVMIGQERAVKAVSFALLSSPGYN